MPASLPKQRHIRTFAPSIWAGLAFYVAYAKRMHDCHRWLAFTPRALAFFSSTLGHDRIWEREAIFWRVEGREAARIRKCCCVPEDRSLLFFLVPAAEATRCANGYPTASRSQSKLPKIVSGEKNSRKDKWFRRHVCLEPALSSTLISYGAVTIVKNVRNRLETVTNSVAGMCPALSNSVWRR